MALLKGYFYLWDAIPFTTINTFALLLLEVFMSKAPFSLRLIKCLLAIPIKIRKARTKNLKKNVFFMCGCLVCKNTVTFI